MSEKFANPGFRSHATVDIQHLGGPASPGEIVSDALAMRCFRASQFVQLDRGGHIVTDGRTPEYRKPLGQAFMLQRKRIPDIGRYFLHVGGVDASDWSDARVMDELMRKNTPHRISLAQSTSDFDGVLVDSINKQGAIGYFERPPTWNAWARRSTVRDYRTGNRPTTTTIPTPTSRNEGGEVKYTTIGDKNQTFQLAEYVGGLRLTRRTLINDDIGEFDRLVRKEFDACKRLEDDLAYAVLNDNQTLAEDSKAIFHTDHNNTGSGGDPSITTLKTGIGAMGTQTENGNPLDLMPAYLLVSLDEDVVDAQQLLADITPAQQSNAIPKIIRDLTIVPTSRIAQATWYLAASTDQIDTVEVVFLESEPMPVVTSEVDFDTDDVKFKHRHSCVAVGIDYRGLYRNTAP